MKERTLDSPNILRAMSDGTPYNIIVKPYLSYDGGGVPVGGHGKVASQTEDRAWLMRLIYTLMYTYINIYKDMYGVRGSPARRGFCWFLSLEAWKIIPL